MGTLQPRIVKVLNGILNKSAYNERGPSIEKLRNDHFRHFTEFFEEIQHMLEQAQALVKEKHIVEGKLVSAEQVLKILEEKLNEPLNPLSSVTFPKVEVSASRILFSV